ncbi:MAG: nickel pincer cofactor biosynthesis protein LarC [Bryobacteraceae bacterium]|nr:nickel pincer cofactor biosynthesis protein LarC [Bryobacteraceae bacterium]
MRICYFDAFSGISGDMTVGALLDAGANFDALNEALTSLGTGATFRAEKTKRKGIAATKFHVDSPEQKAHRHLHHIDKLIDDSRLPDTVKANAKAVFLRLGESEARMHATTLQKVHFHEVGAVDSICDIVGACFCLQDLGVDQIYSGPVNTGSGTVNTEHGILPIPAPATADLLTGIPVYARGPAMELTTPTGAAILARLSKGFGAMPAMKITASGYGAGDRDFPEHANVLRALIGEATGALESVKISVLEANIDDTTPQVLGHTMDRLLEAGALDVTLTPVHMKKNRPGTILSVIAKPEDRERLGDIVFAETTTLGLRFYDAERRVLQREMMEVNLPQGRVRIKVAETGAISPEYDDCSRLASENGIPLRQILMEATAAALAARPK